MMAASCIKTLIWSFIFCFVIMTVWAMATVELVHPIVKELVHENELDDWESTATVMRANLLLFQTVIAGDSWGKLATPVITRSPIMSFIFVGSQLTLVFGVLNLVVAVVVDTFAEQRQKDVENLAQEMQSDEEMDVKLLNKMFKKIDEDRDGEISLEELMAGARKVPEFQSRLRVMDIDEHDLEQLFHMLDTDGGGSIDPNEFISALSRWIHAPVSATRFVKYNMERALQQQQQIQEVCRELKHSVDKLRGDHKRKAKTEREGWSSLQSCETPFQGIFQGVAAAPAVNHRSYTQGSTTSGLSQQHQEELRQMLHAAAEDMKAGSLLHEQTALEDVEHILQGALSRMQHLLIDARALPEAEARIEKTEKANLLQAKCPTPESTGGQTAEARIWQSRA